MNRLFFCLGILAMSFSVFSQTNSSWKEVSSTQKVASQKQNDNIINAKRLFTLDLSQFKQSLEAIDVNGLGKGVSVAIPNSDGKMEQFLVVESSNFVPELQSKYPNIRSYSGIGITDAGATINFSIAPNGVQSMVLRGESGSEFIDPLTDNKSIYAVSTSKARSKGPLPLTCKTADVALNKGLTQKASALKSSNGVFKTMRLALSCTAEYTEYFGGTVADALAGMNATMTRVNGIFNRDLAVKLLLIANESDIIYTNAVSDPYSDATIGMDPVKDCTGDCPVAWNQELQSTLTSKIGEANYDIGHLFAASGGGGDAGCIGCVCSALQNTNSTPVYSLGKGSGYTSPSNSRPEGDLFDIDFVAHEMGHQLGANHIFSYDVEGTGVSVEPGSGSSIMGYAGITDYDVQNSSDDYFGFASIKQIQDNLAIKTCPVKTTISNQTPTVNAGLDYTIPKGTPFVLNGTASDPNGDTMTYCWEQNDSAASKESNGNSIAYDTKTTGPTFRSFLPVSVTNRYFPAFSRVLVGQLTTTWESVSNIGRSLNFVFTARDNASSGLAQTNSDAMVVTVDAAKGPFAVTSQNTAGIGWVLGSSQTITWDVNGTNSLPGSTNVNIKLSTDGGLTFPIILASNTPNDGSEVIRAPATAAKSCRILIEPTGNVFYAVNSTPFTLGYTVETTCNSYSFSAPYSIPESQTYAERTIVVPATDGEITDVNFNVSFTHTYISDVQIEVVSPKGTTVKLFDKSCGATNTSLILTYDDLGGALGCGVNTSQIVVPTGVLASFNGESAQGTWKLRFRDTGVGDSGTIDSASIQICSSAYVPLALPDYEISNFVLYPNPNKGSFTIQFKSIDTADLQVYVTDLSGRKIYQKTIKNTGSISEAVQLPNAAKGTYIVTLVDGERKSSSKIIVK
ncbi:putative secreted protein (Por secretion system target) [Flavobacterium sp. 1]|uniref:zinc-dependent metalloprotease n=1 Tax=Flavobacterium sp. 1 TaxID=2035200 RepID=UPI000C238A48|nr:zinc-dependent metalloprotease family protein [Flavobacterium sp. 1]PJJ09948.1 putative secreted protein (Por secretion system target) [Flavobacterium sp. 1]